MQDVPRHVTGVRIGRVTPRGAAVAPTISTGSPPTTKSPLTGVLLPDRSMYWVDPGGGITLTPLPVLHATWAGSPLASASPHAQIGLSDWGPHALVKVDPTSQLYTWLSATPAAFGEPSSFSSWPQYLP